MTHSNQTIFGIHAVTALIEKNAKRIKQLYVLADRQDKRIQALLKAANTKNIKINYASKVELDRLCDNALHQGAIALCEATKQMTESDLHLFLDDLKTPAFLLILDGVQDPHNLGAILRTAEAAGVQAVIATRDKAVGITPTVSKVASGAAEVVPFVQVTNLARTIDALKEKNIWIYGAAGEAEGSVYQAKLKGNIAIVMGAEGEGLRRLTKDSCDVLINIPMQGSVSSLNVSVATGVILFEALRQRLAL